jgi:vacuolar-type H+-ATPase subunit I/STV1
MALNDTMTSLATRMRMERASRRAASLERRRRDLQEQVDGLRSELTHERETRQELSQLLEKMEDANMSNGHPILRMLVVGGVAYVLGAKAGRGRYEQIVAKGRELRDQLRGAIDDGAEAEGSSASPALGRTTTGSAHV